MKLLQPILGIFLRQLYLIQGNPGRVLPMLCAVTVDMIAWGFMTRYVSSIATNAVDVMLGVMGGVVFWNFIMQVMEGVSLAFLEDLHSRNFLNLFATPLTTSEYIFGLMIASVGLSALGLLLMLAIATTVFGFPVLSLGLMLMPFLLVLFCFGIALGVCSSALVLRFGPSFQALVFAIPALSSPFVGVLYPLSTLPQWMRVVAYLLPPAYVFEAVRAIMNNQAITPSQIVLALGLAALEILAAGWFFTRIFRYTVRTGLLARYSAQSGS